LRPAVLYDTWAAIAFWATLGTTSLYDFAISARHRVPAEARADRGQGPLTLAVIGGIGAAILAAGRVHSLDLPGSRSWPVVAGLTVAWVGFAVRVWAVRTLGQYFTKTLTIQPDQAVIDSGPYALVRHPSYTGLLATTFGFGLALGNLLSIALCFGITTIAFVIRISSEERMLRSALGERYEAFAATRKRLLPGVW
jgi:protein-S-isoprenylcysteine O-methyltransferase Ste14